MKITTLKCVLSTMMLVIPMWIHAFDFTEKNTEGIALNYTILSTSDDSDPAVEIAGLAETSDEIIPLLTFPETVYHDGIKYMVQGIGENAFYNNKTIQSIKISSNITLIEMYAFSKCTNLRSVINSEAIKCFCYGCFADCINLKELHIGPEAYLDPGIFSNCWNLKTLTVSPLNEKYSTDGIGLYDKEMKNLYAIIDSYDGDYTLPSTVECIPYNTWLFGQKIDHLTIPSSVKSIAASTHLSGKIIVENPDPSSISVGERAFSRASSITVPSESVEAYKLAWPEYSGIITNGNYEMSIIANESLSTKKTVLVPVNLRNAEDIIGFQCDIHLPDNADIARDANNNYSISLGERVGKTHAVSTGTPSDATSITGTDKVIRVVCTSLSNAKIKGNEGILFYIPVTLSSFYNIGDTPGLMVIDNIHLSKIGNTLIDVAPVRRLFDEISYLPGDADDDGEVSIVDVTSSISYMVGHSSDNFVFAAVDFDNDGKIMINDITALIDMILGNTQEYAAPVYRLQAEGNETTSENALSVAGITAVQGSDAELVVSLTNESNILGFQCDITLPEGVTINKIEDEDIYDITLSPDRAADHILTSRKVGTNTYRIIVVSLSNMALNGNSGEIFSCPISIGTEVGEYEISLSRIILSAENNVRIDVPNYVGQLVVTNEVTEIIEVFEDNESSPDYYDLHGRRVLNPSNGIYVTKGQKILIK